MTASETVVAFKASRQPYPRTHVLLGTADLVVALLVSRSESNPRYHSDRSTELVKSASS